ncbi:amino acid/amide ABC transporter substrate-binding protein, HAAT family [Desulfocicer vacuolatum DSM 3385]|uniref:Amino acid/amide ABC transporter substrate-binding protein, HAAT family n=1 Tax=Desulfocicer vacuolatum DSM 3385 TaxID=1121400 RepID=A0A1W2DGY4_9BACT|nr:ABC transporter substrate-binding protein [Desulfocicer vacuolatum]SMC96198.1 amino acid/amide ABC transporter substrate-binding protein, HAAT family [Desulfocicer vacuolatum DSM 3385]
MKRLFPWVWVILLTIPPCAMATSSPVTVAAILSTTGIAAPHNLPMIPLIELAVDEINQQGGVLGQPLRLMIMDNQSTPIGSTRAARQAIKNHAIAVIGAHWSSHSLAMAPILQQAKIPMITISTNPDITRVGNYIFRINFHDRFQGQMVAKFARESLNAGTAVVLKNLNETYSMTLTEYFTKEFQQLGGKILLKKGYKGGAVDFQNIISRIKPFHPDVVFIPGYSRDSGLFLRQTVSQGLYSIFMGADAWDDIHRYAGDALEGSYCTAVWHPAMKNPSSRHLQKIYQNRYRSDVINFSAVPWYDAFMLLGNAVGRAKSLKHRKIRDALATTREFQGASGTITFDINGDPVGKEMVILKYEQGKAAYLKTITP